MGPMGGEVRGAGVELLVLMAGYYGGNGGYMVIVS